MGKTSQDKSAGSQESDWLSPWIGRAGGLALVLTAWLSSIFPEHDAKPLAYTGALVVTVIYAGYLFWRRRHQPPQIDRTELEPIGTSLLRSFLPFQQGDTLIGRRTDIADALAILQETEFRFGVIWGESGCGKTSFLRAGLVPELNGRGYTAYYLNRPTDDPIGAIRTKLEQASENTRTFVIVDQFEEYFLSNASHTVASTLARGLKLILEEWPHGSLVIAIRRDFFARLQNFAPDIPDPTSPRSTFELANLRSEAARQVLVQAAADEAVQFEKALIDAVIEDLERDGEVWPVDLQLIGTRLKRAHVREKTVYVTLGRKTGVIGTYIRDEVARLPKPMLGEIILRKLCAPGGIAKSPVDVKLDSIIEDIRARDASILLGTDLLICLKKLQEARIVIQTGDNTFNLTHDALAPLILRGTTGLPGQTETADRSISFYLSAFRDDRRVSIPLRTLLQIRRYATPATLADPQVHKLINKSWRDATFTMSWPAALAIAVLLCVGYGFAFSTWSLGTAPATFTSGPPSIVIRSGMRVTQFLPGANRLIGETGLGVDQMDPQNAVAADHVPRGEIWGFGSIQNAIAQLTEIIKPVEKISFVRHASGSEGIAATFAAIIARDNANTWAMTVASDAIGLTSRVYPDAEADVVIEALIRTRDKTKSPAGKLAVDVALLRMAENRGSIANRVSLTMPHAMSLLTERIVRVDSLGAKRQPSWETPQVESAITYLALNGAKPPTERDLTMLQQILDNKQNDPWARTRVFSLLEAYAAREGRLAGPVLHYLLTLAGQHQAQDWMTWGAMRLIPIISRNHPQALGQVLRPGSTAFSLLSTPDDKTIEAVAIPISLIARSAAPSVPAGFSAKLKARANDSTASASVRAAASIALCHLAAADPRLRDLGATRQVIDLLRDTIPSDSALRALRREAVSAAAHLAAAGQLDPSSIQLALKSLGKLLRDDASARVSDWTDQDIGEDLQRLAGAGGQVDGQLIEGIIQSIKQPAFTGLDRVAVDMLIAAAKISPSEVLRKQAMLDAIDYRNGIRQEFDRALRLKVLAALGQADAATGSTNERLKRCTTKLMTRLSAEAWQQGAFCAFFAGLGDPALLPQLRSQLLSMMEQGFIRRTAARLTLEMLTDVQRVVDARNNTLLIPIIRARLRHDLEDKETHVAIAAQASLQAMAALDL